MAIPSLFLSEESCHRDFSMLGDLGYTLELGLQHSLSEEVLLTSRTATQCGQVSPPHLSPLSLLLGSVIYNPCLARHFASKVVNQLSLLLFLLGMCRSSSPLWLCGSGKVGKHD